MATKKANDQRANNGGARVGAGRKSKVDEETKNNLFIEAIKQITEKDTPDEAKTELLVKLWNTSSRGQLFIAEHVFGKTKEIVEVTNKNEFPDLSNFSTSELEKLMNNEENGING
tara:strand:+ start:87 stop:431 length:345 start_codon:yes stop_codon:yes gene_type:complete